MKFKEIHNGIIFNEKDFKKQKRIFKRLLNDLEKAIEKYYNNSLDGYGISLLSIKDLSEWDKLGNPNKTEFYWQGLSNLWNIKVALTYCLSPIPVEDVL